MPLPLNIPWHCDLLEEPTQEPISLDEVRNLALRIPGQTVEDAIIRRYITTARRMGERRSRRAFVPQTRAMYLDRLPTDGCSRAETRIELPYPPLIRVESFTYIDLAGDEQTLTEDTDFKVVRPKGPTAQRGHVEPSFNTTWPSTRDEADAVCITYRAGYQTEGSPAEVNTPDDLVAGMLLVIGELYKQRSESVTGVGVSTTPAVLRARHIWDEFKAY